MTSFIIFCLYFAFALLWSACTNIDTPPCPGNSDSEIADILNWEEYYKDRIQFAAFSTDSNSIRYRYDSEREHLALNLVKRNDQYILQIFEEFGFFISQRTSSFKEIQLSQSQVESILSKVERIKCLPYNLDAFRNPSHINRYFVMIEDDWTIGAIKWIDVGTTSRDSLGRTYLNTDKKVVQELCCYLIKLTGISLSEKGIVLNDHYKGDSLQYEVFIKRGYVAIDFTVLFDGQIFEHDEFFVTKLMVHKSDTQNIESRIKISEVQWDDSISIY